MIINTILREIPSPRKAPEGYLSEILEAMIVLSEEHELHWNRSWAHLNPGDKKRLYQGWRKKYEYGWVMQPLDTEKRKKRWGEEGDSYKHNCRGQRWAPQLNRPARNWHLIKITHNSELKRVSQRLPLKKRTFRLSQKIQNNYRQSWEDTNHKALRKTPIQTIIIYCISWIITSQQCSKWIMSFTHGKPA